jgi:hypothetical protein
MWFQIFGLSLLLLGQQQTTDMHPAKGAYWYCSGGIVCFGEIIQTPSIPTIRPLDDDSAAYACTGAYAPPLLPHMPRLPLQRLMCFGSFLDMKMVWPAEVDKWTFLPLAVASAQSCAAGYPMQPSTIEDYAVGQAALIIAKLRVGMTEAEVSRLLGPAWHITGFVSWYECGPLTVNVSYDDGRLDDFDISGCSHRLFCRRIGN